MTHPTPAEALHRFPLVPRPHPVRAPLDTRLTEIGRLVAGAASAADPRTVEAVAWNHAALLASDHHLPDLARQLCRHHHQRYDNLETWDDRTARLALEPLINLARLHLRDHDPDTAMTLLAALSAGVDTRTDTTVDDLAVRTSRITDHPRAPTPPRLDLERPADRRDPWTGRRGSLVRRRRPRPPPPGHR